MKQTKWILVSLWLLFSLGLTACNQDSPKEATLFVGKYIGDAGFVKIGGDNSQLTLDKDVTITVIKVGKTYTFRFSNDIPTLRDVQLEKGEDTLVTVGSSETAFVKITGTDLTINYVNDKGFWSASAKREK